jgi:hypothetical protein
MSGVLLVFRKDVRRLWPRILLVVGIETLGRWVHPAQPNVAGALINVMSLEALAQWFLIASAIHEERLVGDRQYWLTRPISWRTLLAAKLLFFVVFVHLPVLAASVNGLLARGESPAAHWAGLAMVQFATLGTVLCGAAVAAASAGMVQFVGVSLAAVMAPAVIALLLASRILGSDNMNWGGVEWLHFAAENAVTIVAASAILALQYSTRRTALSRLLLASLAVAVGLAMWAPGWHAAFAFQSRLGERAPDSAVRIVQDSPRGGELAPLPRSAWRGDPSAVEVPILVTGVPPGMAVWSDRIAATGVLADGSVWSSGWDSLNRLGNAIMSGNIASGRTTREEGMLPGADPWLYLNVDPYFASSDYSAGRELHATMALTLLSSEEITPLQAGGGPTRVPQGGLCWVMGMGNLSILCSWPAPTPGYAVIRISAMGMPTGFEMPLLSERLFGNLSYGPCTNTGGLWQTVTGNVVVSAGPSEILLVTRRAVAHFEREIEIHPGGGQLP